VLLGICIKQYASLLLDASILAIITGTFVYIIATKIIPKENEDS